MAVKFASYFRKIGIIKSIRNQLIDYTCEKTINLIFIAINLFILNMS